MSRAARKKSESQIYHIMLRGINHQSIFVDDEDREKFIHVLGDYKGKCQFKLYGYCLMGNHVHILLKEEKDSLAQIIKRISSTYVFWYNWKYERSGHLFQERFKSEPVENDNYFLTVLRYIHQNPVKAGLVNNARDYKWSSYNEYIYKNRISDVEFGLELIALDISKRIQAFIKYTNETSNDICMEIEEKTRRISDNELNVLIKDTFGVNAIQIQNENEHRQSEILKQLKELDGVTLRQISRITGFTIHKVFRA
ncbi:MAG: transposase [Clostridia bacterium]